MVLRGSKHRGSRYVSQTLNHEGKLKCGLLNGHRMNLWSKAGFKDEFDAYVRNADLEDFVSDKCRRYYYLIDSFVQMFEFSSKRNTHTALFDLYDESYTMDIEDFNTACKIPQWGLISEPHKAEYNDFLASITVGETRNITQATIGSIHFPSIHYFCPIYR